MRIEQETNVPTKKPRLSVVVDEELMEYLERWATEEERSVSNLALKIIKEAVRQRQTDSSKIQQESDRHE